MHQPDILLSYNNATGSTKLSWNPLLKYFKMPYYTTIVYLIKKRLQKSFKKMKYIASILILHITNG